MHNRFFLLLFMYSLAACKHQSSTMQLTDKGIISGYKLVNNWLQLPFGYTMGSPAGLGTDSNQHIFIFCRAGREWSSLVPMPSSPISGNTILEIDNTTGKLVNSWGDHFFIMPHGLTVDKEDNIWVTDVGLHQVFKFSHSGQLLLTLGEAGVAGNDATHFNMPTGTAIAKDGAVYVSDGYGNSRIVKFSAAGAYLFEWGKKGSSEKEFDIPHAICLDDNDHVYVADRENRRIQVFDSSGRFLKMLQHHRFGNICSVLFNEADKYLVAVDDLIELGVKHTGSDIIVFDTTGNSFSAFGRSGAYDGPVCWYHDIAIDKEGSIYVADIIGDRVLKFKKEGIE
jgi:peptidylamidoglycolate lyase